MIRLLFVLHFGFFVLALVFAFQTKLESRVPASIWAPQDPYFLVKF